MLVRKAVNLRLLGGAQLGPEGVVLLLRHGAVDVVRGTPVVAGGEEGALHVHALEGDQGGRRVVEVEGGVRPQQGLEPLRQGVGGQGAGGDDHLPLRDLGHLAGHHGDMGVAADLLRHHAGEAVAVHRQCAAGLHPGGVGALEDQGAQPPQLLFQKAHSVFQLVAPQGVGAAQLREVFCLMGGGLFFRLHLPEGDVDTPLGQLPGSLRAGQAGADNCYIHSLDPLSIVG